jgi:methionyl-tRNA formyltransferase
MKKNDLRIAFFGTSHIARFALEEIVAAGFTPTRIVTAPDTPQGRGLAFAPSNVALWADTRGLSLSKPEKITTDVISELAQHIWDVFIVIDYGYILPRSLLEIPRRGTLNIHPSLLPRLRGPSPIRSAILTDEKDTGVTVMVLDEKMDHGPIITQRAITTLSWPPHVRELEELLAREGGKALAAILPDWLDEKITAQPQNHAAATFCKMFTKEDGLLDLHADGYTNLLKIRALEGWPGTYTFFERNGTRIRVKILDANLDADGSLAITRIIPEGKREMSYEEFLRSGATPIASVS